MKFKTTKKEIMNNYPVVIQIPYGYGHHITGSDPIAYTCGQYGWNADIFPVGNRFALVTGYRPFGIKAPMSIIQKYDALAADLDRTDYEQFHEQWTKLRYKFIAEVNQ